MLEVPQKYKEMAEKDAHEVSVKVVMGETVLTNDDIIELDIYRSTGENGFSIGGAVTTRVRLLCVMKLPYSGEVAMDVFVRFGFDEKGASDYVQLGHFYGHASNPSHKTAQVEIIGYDKLGSSAFNSRCTFAKVGGAELTFPCTVQEMLEYVCKRRNIETDFRCLDYTVSEIPVKDMSKDNSDYEKYYTYKEIISFIAAAHGANAAIDRFGKLVFVSAKETGEIVNKSDCIDFALTSSEKFTVKGVLLHVQNVLSTGSTNIFINDDSKTSFDGEISDGVTETSCPFGSIEIAEALWGQLGGLSYNSCEFTRRGRGWTEPGDIVSAVDDLREKVNGEYISRKIIAQTVELSFSAAGGFIEHIISKAENSEESVERLGSANVINNASGGVGEFTNEDKNSEIFNSYKDVTNESGTVTAKRNYINPKTPYAHVAGEQNSIDDDKDIENISGTSAILSGTKNAILSAPCSTIIGGIFNTIKNCPQAAIATGNNNTIEGTASSAFIGGGFKNQVLETCSVVAGGADNVAKTSYGGIFSGQYNEASGSLSGVFCGSFNKALGHYSAILNGLYNSIDKDATTGCCVVSGSTNIIGKGGISSVIVGGSENKILEISCWASTILGGNKNSINGSVCSSILSGTENKITGGTNSVILCGYRNTLNGERCVVSGENNIVNGNCDIVCGYQNKTDYGPTGRIICGSGATTKTNGPPIMFAIGGGYSGNEKNIFFVNQTGDVYAHSFNIIGETASEASAFSAKSVDSPDISELAEQIRQMKEDIEALKSENQALKAEISSLK
ncbi:MAG: hypothetical protein HFE79_00165 [Ruminiclostridium sp.]|nr:hypothetical protein [Ruminiclostridium sp.]